jgi:hypothetical protein
MQSDLLAARLNKPERGQILLLSDPLTAKISTTCNQLIQRSIGALCTQSHGPLKRFYRMEKCYLCVVYKLRNCVGIKRRNSLILARHRPVGHSCWKHRKDFYRCALTRRSVVQRTSLPFTALKVALHRMPASELLDIRRLSTNQTQRLADASNDVTIEALRGVKLRTTAKNPPQ